MRDIGPAALASVSDTKCGTGLLHFFTPFPRQTSLWPRSLIDRPSIRKIGVPCAGYEGGLRWFYVSEPTSAARGMPGRATRGYPAWDPVTRAIVFIKDSWRSDTGDLLKEADVLRTHNAQNAEHAPTLICGGDLPGQRKKHHPRVHHRFAINFGQPLWRFRSTKHLLQILHDAFTCHWQAVERCRKLHRDLSAWNIFWDEESGRGFLADWDLCAPMPPKGASDTDPTVNMMAEVPPASGRPERTGTWMFMSTRSLETASKLHDIQDDLEALFWVAVYMTILYTPFPEANAIHIVDNVLMKHTFVGGVAYGGAAKADFLVDPSNGLYKIELSDCPVISAWLRGYRRLIHKWIEYHMQKVEDGDDDDAFPAFLPPTDAQAPPFDYATLDQAWVGMMENGERKGLFREGDRCDDEAHQLHPFEVTALYRDRVAQEEEEEEKEEEEAGAVYVPAQQSSTNPQDDNTSRAPSAVHLDAATSQGDTNAGPTPDSAANDTDDEGARRGAKRQRTARATFTRTTPLQPDDAGRPPRAKTLRPSSVNTLVL